jgi:hypothetical protein
MQLQLITLCDSASDYQGKLCILGSFDTLCAREFPVAHPQCSLALRLLFAPQDVGQHHLRIELKSEAGLSIMPAFTPIMDVNFPPGAIPFVSRNLVLNLQRLHFEKAGVYFFVVNINGDELATLPLRVTRYDEMRGPHQPAG